MALACAWHEHHEATRTDLERREHAGESIGVACHSLVEAYAVLTRLPPPHRLSPAEAHAVLRGSWKNGAASVLSPAEHWELLESAAAGSIAGGRTYDALIAACARRAGASVLLTWNLAHFASLGGDGLEVATPRA